MSVTLHTDMGDIKMELFCDLVPKTCENFLALCATGYYKDCTFHRTIKGFMVQTGDPTGTGKGGECIWGGKFDDEFHENLKVRGKKGDIVATSVIHSHCHCCYCIVHCGCVYICMAEQRQVHTARGMVSMANSGQDSNGSQFFIALGKHPHLDLKYSLFGKVIDGFDVLDDLEKMPVEEKTFRPKLDIRIRRITIHANPLAD